MKIHIDPSQFNHKILFRLWGAVALTVVLVGFILAGSGEGTATISIVLAIYLLICAEAE